MKNKKLSAKTKLRLIEVANAILSEPALYSQSSAAIPNPNNCASAGCIFGWARSLFGKVREIGVHATFVQGSKLIGLEFKRVGKTIQSGDEVIAQANRLFWKDQWPEPFKQQLENAEWGSEEAAKVAALRILHFIRTEGAE